MLIKQIASIPHNIQSKWLSDCNSQSKDRNFVLVLTHLEARKNYKDLYGVTGAWKANISSTNCNEIVIFGKYTFIIMYFQNILANPIKIKKIFNTLSTL